MAKMKFIPELNTNQFTYNPRSQTFVCEASDLRGFKPRRIYDDACDIGFYMVSEKTGQKLLFVENEPTYDADGDLISFNFSSHCYENPSNLMQMKVIIFND